MNYPYKRLPTFAIPWTKLCPLCKQIKSLCQCGKDDIAILFVDKNDTSKGFTIYARRSNRVKTFAIPFKATYLPSYVSDLQTWPEMTPAEKAKIETLFSNPTD